MERTITAVAASIGLLIVLALPTAYYTFARSNLDTTLATEVEINARLITMIVNANPGLWQFQTERLTLSLQRRPDDGTPETRRVYAGDGALVVTSEDPLSPPIVSRRSAILDSGRVVGSLEIARSLRPAIIGTAAATAFAALLAMAAFIALRVLPLSALRRVIEQLEQEQQSALRLQSEKQLAVEAASNAKSQFLATMSHEIRTPLNGVLGMAELLQGTPLTETQRKYTRAISVSGRMLRDLLSDILDLAQIEAGTVKLEIHDFEPMSLATEIADVYRELAVARGIMLATDFDPAAAGRVAGDPARLRQVLSNLLGNSVKFTAAGSITLQMQKLDSLAGDARTWLRFRVRDTGVGIAPGMLNQLFQPFTQADGSTTRLYGGSGLGLAICKRMVELMEGSIHLDSASGRGTTAWFDVPFNAASSPAPLPVVESPLPQRIAARVLLVEDNPTNQDVVSMMLSGIGSTVTVVGNGALAVEALKRDRFDVVFMDCQMPVMDGYRATAEIRGGEAGEHTPIIGLTANAFAEDRQRCLDAGMDDYLAKPTSVADLVGKLARWAPAAALNGEPAAGAATPVEPAPMAPPTSGERPPASDGCKGVDGSNGIDRRNAENASPQAVDAATIEALRKMLGAQGTTFVARTVAKFITNTRANLASIANAITASDCPAVRTIAHGLKSSSAYLGAKQLAGLCATLEQTALEGDARSCTSLAQQVYDEFSRAEIEFNAYL